MKSLEAIRSVKQSHEDTLLKLPGVTGVDVGPKIVAGQKTPELSIRVYVAKKKSEVPPQEVVPKEIDGVKTDVIERRFVLHAAPAAPRTAGTGRATAAPTRTVDTTVDAPKPPAPRGAVLVTDLRPMADTATHDPIIGGISIGPCSAVGGYIYVGTLGALVIDRTTKERLALTNYHVLAEKWPVGESYCQPSRPDGGSCPAQTVGTLVRSVLSERVDGAVGRFSGGRGTKCSIKEIGNVAGQGTAVMNMVVRKRGRTTGLTHGTVDSIDATVNVPYDDGVHTLKHQILIDVDPAKSTAFGLGGDSGSVVVDKDNKIIGLYFAGTEDGSVGVANPIQSVLDELNVDLCVPPKLKTIYREKIFVWEKLFIREGWKDRYKEVAYEKPPFSEAIQWPWEELINPPPFEEIPGIRGRATGDTPASALTDDPAGTGDSTLDTPLEELADPADPTDPGADSGGLEQRVAQLEKLASGGGALATRAVWPPLTRLVCSDFRTAALGFGPNPRVVNGATFRVFNGALPAPNTQVIQLGGLRGLRGRRRTRVTHAATGQVIVTLARFAVFPGLPGAQVTARAFNAANVLVDSAVTAVGLLTETSLTLNAAGITRVELTTSGTEFMVRRYCRRVAKPLKEIIKEKPEIWENKHPFKEKLETLPEGKQLIKEKPEPKELVENPDIPIPDDPFGRDPANPDRPDGGPGPLSLEERLARLESAFGVPHFIDDSLRPDLSQGALTQESDCGCSGGAGT